MEQKYKRIEDLDEKIKNISLPYLEWKVLFLVAEGTAIKDIAKYISEEEDVLTKTLESLLGKELVALSTADEEAPAVEEEAEKPVSEKVEEIDLKEEEYEEAPFEDETKIQVTEVTEETEEAVDEIPEMEEEMEEEPVDDVTEMPELVEEESELAEAEAEPAVAEAEKEPPVSEGEIMADFMPETEEKAEEPAEPPTEKETEKPVKDEAHKSIMVIDDSIVIRKMIEIALEDEEFNILNATSGKEGMEAIEKEKPDLVILDMLLPDMNGIDVLKKIKDSINVPVIMLSGKDSPQLVENAKEVGVNDFLPKPFKDEELVEKVKALMN